jgi:hypothetical protein
MSSQFLIVHLLVSVGFGETRELFHVLLSVMSMHVYDLFPYQILRAYR